VRPLAAPLLGASGASLAPIPGAGGLADPSGLALAPGDRPWVAVSLAVVLGAALAPDLDSAGSTAARSLGLASRSVAWAVQHVLHHRGPLHSALAVLVAGVLFALLGAQLGLSGLGPLVAFGWASHVLADAVTDRGVPLLWPLRRRRVRLPYGLGPATGGPGEVLLVGAFLLLCGWWVFLAPRL
jgi:inner membrane protein